MLEKKSELAAMQQQSRLESRLVEEKKMEEKKTKKTFLSLFVLNIPSLTFLLYYLHVFSFLIQDKY